MYNEKPLFDNSDFFVIKDHEYIRKNRLSNIHYHSEFEFVYVKKGCVKFYVDQKEYEVKEGNIFFVNSNIIHYTECTQNNTVNILLQFKNPSAFNYSISYLPGFIKKKKISYYLFNNNDPDTEILRGFIESILEEKKTRNYSYKNFISAYLYLITAFMQRKKILPDGRDFHKQEEIEKLIPLFEYIDKNYGEHISLEDLSNLMHLNEAYLCRVFKEITGGTITEYINYTRVHKATKMLKNDMTLSEIAYQCGFASLTYFNRVFKKYRNYSASEYRKIDKYEEIEI